MSRAALALVLLVSGLVACEAEDVAPTPTPATLAPEPSVSAAYVEFRGRATAAVPQVQALIVDLSTASAGSTEDVAAAAQAMSDWADSATDWLTANPAEPCYQAAFDAHRAAVAAFAEAADGFAGLDPASPDPSRVSTAATLLDRAVSGFAGARSAADAAGADCTT
jgi:hypothetical protein